MTSRDPAVANAGLLYAKESDLAVIALQQIRSVSGSTDTPTSSDNNKLVTITTSSGTVTITINSSLGLSAGQRIDFIWLGATTAITFSASGTTLNGTPGLKLRERYSAATLLCVGTNSYVLIGDLSA